MNRTLSVLSAPPLFLYGLSLYCFYAENALFAIYFWLVGMVVDRLMDAVYKAVRRCRRLKARKDKSPEGPHSRQKGESNDNAGE